MTIEVQLKKFMWGAVFVLLLIISFAMTQFGLCSSEERGSCESLLTVWRGIMMFGCIASSVFVMLFGVLEVHK